MRNTNKKAFQLKSRRTGAQIRWPAPRLTNLLGDFSEQIGAQFG